MNKIAMLLLITACQTPQPPNNWEDIRHQLSTLRHFVYSNQYIDAVHGCEISGRICALQTKDARTCQQKTEQCVVLNYRQWLTVKKQYGYP